MKKKRFPKNSIVRLGAAVFLFLFTSLTLPATRGDLLFHYLGVKEGLSQGTVFCILKDHKGFMWFGTVDGLNRYDGISFTTFYHDVDDPQSLSGSEVNCLFEDRDGNLWVGTESGLNRMENGTYRFHRFVYTQNDSNQIISNSIQSICQDLQGNIWVGTDRGLDCLINGEKRFIHYQPGSGKSDGIADRSIRFVLAGRDGRIWIGFREGGVDCYNPETGRFEHFIHDPDNENTLADDRTVEACINGDGSIWITHPETWISRIDAKSGEVTRFNLGEEAQMLGGICADSRRDIWITSGRGLYFLDTPGGELTRIRSNPRFPATLNTDSLQSVYIDETDFLWIGASYFGVNQANLNAKRFINYIHDPINPDTLGFSFVRGIYEDREGVLYIGGNGFDRLDRKEGSWKHFSGEKGNPFFGIRSEIYSICPNSDDPGDILWIATSGDGIFVFNPRRQEIRPYSIPEVRSKTIYGLFRDTEGCLWIGTDREFYRHDPEKKETLSFDPEKIAGYPIKKTSVSGVYWFMHDRRGILWVGSRGYGVFTYDSSAQKWRHFFHDPKNPGSLSSDLVTSILETQAGEIWISTYGGGINRMNRDTGNCERFTTGKGLPNNVAYGILEDKRGRLWISTNRGLCRFDPKTGIFRSYMDKEGLTGNEFNTQSFFKNPANGEMLFGGTNGLNAFFPDEIPDDPNPPTVVLEDLRIFNRSIQPGPGSILKKPIDDTDALFLSYRDSMLTFEFNGIHYAAPARNRFAYFLEGFDKEWNETGAQRRYATYTNLNPGRYTLRIKAANSDGVWNETGKTLIIHIAPPFWKTWWFRILSLISVMIMLFAFYRLRVRGLQKKKAELEHEVAERTQELKEMSLSDPMTNLRNRRYVSEVVMEEIENYLDQRQYVLEKGQRRKTALPGATVGLMLIDVDFFKKVNDRYGHKAGDLFLSEFASILKENVRSDDVIVRWGGEEFLLILKNCDPAYLPAIAEKIRKGVEFNEFSISATETLQVRGSCCIGIVQFPFVSENPRLISFDQAVILADMAMYLGKESGRNRTVYLQYSGLIPDEKTIQAVLNSLDVLKESGFVKINTYSSASD